MAMKRRSLNGFADRLQRITETTRRELTRELEQIEKERAALTSDLDEAAAQIRRTLETLGGADVASRKLTHERGARKAKRVRRDAEQLKAEADAIFKLIKNSGPAGIRGNEIRRRFPKTGPSIKAFVEKHGEHRIKTTGKKATTRYLAA